jgi:putative aldouronate transport system permease protein
MFLLVLYPLIFVISSSFSSADAVSSGKVILWPVDFSTEGYETVFENSQVGRGYLNSIFYTVFGTLISLSMTMMAAYALARKDLPFRGPLMFLFTFTMLFDGGMIPNYMLMRDLHFLNTPWAILLPGAIAVYNMIITRTFIAHNIPNELRESAEIDGCTDFQYFFRIVLPLSKAIIAVIALYYAVFQWNSYFSAFLYLTDKDLFPLQIVLRDILLANTIEASAIVEPELMAAKQGLADLLKYALIIVSSIPMMIVYPFIQKYFVKGVMIGSLKG